MDLKTNHSIRIAILATGEQLLCIFGEVRGKEEEIVGYRLMYPFALGLGEPNEDGTLPIKYNKWCPFTPVQEFKMTGDHIISVTYPDNNILENYVTELERFGIERDKLFGPEPEETNGDNSEPAEAAE